MPCEAITILCFGDCDTEGKVIPYSVLKDIDERIEGIEDERAELLRARNLAMQAAAGIANKVEEPDVRRVIFRILDEHDTGSKASPRL